MKNSCFIRLAISQAGVSPVCPPLSHAGEPRTGPDVALPVDFYLWAKDRITLLCLLSPLLLMQPRMPIFSLLFSKGTLLACVQLVYQDSTQVLFCKAEKSIFVEMSSRSVAFIYYCMSLGFMVNKHVSIWWWNPWLAWNHCVLWWEVKILLLNLIQV